MYLLSVSILPTFFTDLQSITLLNILFTNFVCLLAETVTLPPIVSGCLSNNDCPDYTACQARKCINPCAAPNVCAPNANCRVTRHQAVCTCPDGYIGSPEISCSLRKFEILLL